jgi:hypothetical protein
MRDVDPHVKVPLGKRDLLAWTKRMESSLHRQLKEIYADRGAKTEVSLGQYRIDVVCDEELVEIQHGSLAAIRDKVRQLLRDHRVLVVKPIVVRKRLVRQAAKGGPVIDRRLSPKRGSILSLFDELVYFTRVFPHRNLSLEVPLVDIEEWRFPGHGRRRRHRERDHQVEDQKLDRIHRIHRFRTASDLSSLIPQQIPRPFHTGHLAQSLGIERWVAQRIAYCLRNTGACTTVGKQGNSLLYEWIG